MKGEVKMEDIVTNNMILKELREFRADNDKKWAENDKRWEENEKRWEENEKRWEENNKRWEKNDKKIDDIDARVKKIENNREADKQEIFRIMNSIDETIKSEFDKMRNELDIRFNKIEAILDENKMEHKMFKEKIEATNSRINLHEVRIQKLEDWKGELDTGSYLPV